MMDIGMALCSSFHIIWSFINKFLATLAKKNSKSKPKLHPIATCNNWQKMMRCHREWICESIEWMITNVYAFYIHFSNPFTPIGNYFAPILILIALAFCLIPFSQALLISHSTNRLPNPTFPFYHSKILDVDWQAARRGGAANHLSGGRAAPFNLWYKYQTLGLNV